MVDSNDQVRFLNRLRILRSIDQHEVPLVEDWQRFCANPPEYVICCGPVEAQHIWMAVRRREVRA